MKKIIMVDGNNLVFRSYYATAYSGNYMKNSKGFPTNALLGFANMINKIVSEEKPTYMIVAFDKGKTFRHEKYDFYKEGRSETPEELKLQFPKAKELLDAMGIKYYEIDNYEADDIIGTFAKYCDEDDDYDGTIISSDKDLLQLISDHVDIKLLKQKDYIRYNLDTFRKDYGIEPINIIDLKALMGDASDNIPGVKGIGEKTALKLLQEYHNLDGVYQNTDNCTPSIQKKLIADKANAYMSYEIATIYRDVPMDINIDDIIYKGPNNAKLNTLYEDLEFYSLLRKNKKATVDIKKTDTKIINNIDDIQIDEDVAIYLELTDSNYHKAEILGMSVYNPKISYFIPYEALKKQPSFLTNINKYTYDLKKTYTALKWHGILFDKCDFDLMIAAYLLEYNLKEDIAVLANSMGYDIPFENQYPKDIDKIADISILKAKFIYENQQLFTDKLKEEELINLFLDLEMPLSLVLADMEYTGFRVDRSIIDDMGEDIKIKLDLLEHDIYNQAGEEFNVSSPIQMSHILYDKLGLPHGNKKIKSGYSTATDVLEKIKNKHPIIPLVIEYRMLSKLYSSYIEGLKKTIHSDGKIHTIYTQTVARTGRLSSIEPNLQNIPIRYKYGRLIRKAFLPSDDSVILSSDYSQIELRILSHVASIDALKEAFVNHVDIHTKTASDVFHIGIQEVTDEQRRMAKAINFGIIYGISSFGLSEQINITPKEAQKFIDSYLESYPGIKEYMDKSIKQAKELGFVKTLFNRKRSIPEINNKNYMIRSSAERMALNTPIQGTSADIIKKAMIDIYQAFKKKGIKSKMLVQVHDELVFDCLKEELEQVKSIVKEVMENVYKLDIPLEVHIDYGNDWYQAK